MPFHRDVEQFECVRVDREVRLLAELARGRLRRRLRELLVAARQVELPGPVVLEREHRASSAVDDCDADHGDRGPPVNDVALGTPAPEPPVDALLVGLGTTTRTVRRLVRGRGVSGHCRDIDPAGESDTPGTTAVAESAVWRGRYGFALR